MEIFLWFNGIDFTDYSGFDFYFNCAAIDINTAKKLSPSSIMTEYKKILFFPSCKPQKGTGAAIPDTVESKGIK